MKKRDLRLHPHAVRTGDYYMFEKHTETDEPILYEEYDFLEREDRRARELLISVSSLTFQMNLTESILFTV